MHLFNPRFSMGEQEHTRVTPKGREDHQKPQRPANDDIYAWSVIWRALGQPWRTEPEIDEEREKYLGERRNITTNFQRDIHPFSGVKLDRADVEWLLATHENGRGPVDSRDESQRWRQGVDLRGADLSHAFLRFLPLGGTLFLNAQLESADLFYAHLENANLINARMEGANLIQAHLEGANLYNAFFDSATRLDNVIFSDEKLGAAKFTDVHWGDVNLAVVDWSTVSESGDESTGRHLENRKIAKTDLRSMDGLKGSYKLAARAYRQLSVVLRNQGLTEDAARFAYRAQLTQRKVLWYQHKFGQYLFSLFLDLLAGYGFKAWRSFAAYLIIISMFAIAYYILGHTVGPVLSPLGSVVFSITSFHGRGFFPGGIKLDDPLTVLAAIEAFAGLLIEVTFIATLTQRLFGK
jgi:uncharacterized protein YjbI with pentapeptide repeats